MKKLLLTFGFGIIGYTLFGRSGSNAASSSNTSSTIDFRTDDLTESRSTRNNNPGNVKKPGSVDWNGTVKYDEIGHAVFENYILGSRAFIKDVMAKISRGLNTINKFLPVYCPSSDGCPIQDYIAFVEKKSGVSRYKVLNTTSKTELFKILYAMALYESGSYTTGPNKGKPRTKFNQYFFNEAFKIL